MPLSSTTLTGVNAVQTYTIGFGVITADTLTVTVDAVAYVLGTDWTLNAAKTQITFINPTFTGGESIYLERTSPIADADRPVDYTAGAVLTEEDLDNANLHLLHLIQEAADDTAEALQIGSDAVNWDAESKKILNLAAPVLPSDAARLQDVQDAAIASGQLPAVTVGDNGSLLGVAAGRWNIRTPTDVRTALGLGTAALEDTGTNVGDVVTVQTGGELPALLGTNLDLSGNTSIPGAGDNWKVPTAFAFFNNLAVVADVGGATYATSSSYDVPTLSQSNSGVDASANISIGAGTVTLQPGLYRATLVLHMFGAVVVGAGYNATVVGGLYKGNTGAVANARMVFSLTMPNTYPAAGEQNAPMISRTSSCLLLVVPATTLELRVKLALTGASDVTGDVNLDANFGAGHLMIEVLQDDPVTA